MRDLNQASRPCVAVIGGGPAGLMAAEVLAAGGVQVDLFDAMPSVGRKFLLAGKGGLNLTHGEAAEAFTARYGTRRAAIESMLSAFGPQALREWAAGLGISTFIGSSGRVFPTDLKAAPLLRAWLHRLRASGVAFHMRNRWLGWEGEGSALRFATPQGERRIEADAVLLALGGASWSQLGSDGAWVPLLEARGVEVAPLRPSNCGFDVARPDAEGHLSPGWSDFFRERFAGAPLKNVALKVEAADGRVFAQFVVTAGGVEGSLVYALSAAARDTIDSAGSATVHLDLLPGRSVEFVRDEVARPRGSRSLATHLKSRLGIDGVKAALLYELLQRDVLADAARLATAIKALPLVWAAPRPIDEAISSAGGVRLEALDAALMAHRVPGLFCAGEMLDWEAPTGGYLLTASFASGHVAARGALAHLGL
jgi:uncharacterized flavoprotein (TIGR03862 family)